VSFDRRGEAIFVASDLRPVLGDLGEAERVALDPAFDRASARALALDRLGATGALHHESSELAVFPGADGARVVWALQIVPRGTPSGSWEVLVDAGSGEIVRVEDRALYGDTGQGQSYLPDPLASSGNQYGDTGYVDGADADTTQLTNEIFEVPLLDLTFDGGASVWRLTGPWADCREIELPTDACATSSDLDFRVLPASRSNQDFEDMLVYYHIDTFMRYINVDLGVSVTPFQYVGGVRFDSHGFNGADNSRYSGAAGDLSFGEGGVDDSEDPDVVIHELGHGIHDWVTNGNLSQTQGLSEGVGDYLAGSYSRRAFPGTWTPADPEWDWVFKWDGHNPFWPGRLLDWNDTHRYTTALGGLHTTGQFWSSCNLDIAEQIGYAAMDEAMLEGLSTTGSSTNHAQAAQAVINAANALGYNMGTMALMVHYYNSNNATAGCNYGVTFALPDVIFIDGFAFGTAEFWDVRVPFIP
jgi:hypothetical protein